MRTEWCEARNGADAVTVMTVCCHLPSTTFLAFPSCPELWHSWLDSALHHCSSWLHNRATGCDCLNTACNCSGVHPRNPPNSKVLHVTLMNSKDQNPFRVSLELLQIFSRPGEAFEQCVVRGKIARSRS